MAPAAPAVGAAKSWQQTRQIWDLRKLFDKAALASLPNSRNQNCVGLQGQSVDVPVSLLVRAEVPGVEPLT